MAGSNRPSFAALASAAALLACLLLPAASDAAGAWSIQNPTSVTLAGLSCPDTSNCWTVGATGTVAVTNDGGATWSTQSSGTRNNLNSVACTSSVQCVAVGNKAGAGTNGVILTTPDGGATWAAQNSGTGNNLTAVSCASASTCWAVGQAGTILKTTNGGGAWTPQTSGTTTQLNGITCLTTTTCYVVGNKDGKGTDAEILTTVNGGTTWTEQVSATTNNLNEISCADAAVCRAVGQSGTIVTTANGGTTWTVQSSGTTQALTGVSCASATTCRATGAAGTIVATNDGSTWSAQTSGKAVALNAVACVDAGTCWSVGATGTIIATTDGGSTWAPQTSGTNAALRGVSCISASSCWAVGNNGVILNTVTGGVSWLLQTSGVTKQLNSVSCVGFGTCYAVGATNGAGTNALILKTVNGGATWTSQNSNTTNQLFAVACTSATTCWAAGQNGTIVATTNGTTWAAQSSGVTKQLNDLACPTSTTCFAAGATNGAGTNGIVVKTTNGGSAWSQQNSATNVNLNGVACADASHCWVAAQSGKIAATTDGGGTWSLQTSGTAANLNGVACADTSTCWAVGNNTGAGTSATIVATTNGGATWSAQTSNTTNNLLSATFVDSSYGWAVGNAGTVDAYVDDSTPPPVPSIDSEPFSPGTVTSPAWSFSGEDGATFECRLDRGTATISDWSACSGDASYDLTGEPDGAYTFAVRATDAAGNTGTQAESVYTLDTTAAAPPNITTAPAASTSSRTPSWSFTGEVGVTFECRLDRGGVEVFDWATCTSAKSYALLAQPDGLYTFSVRAVDAAGNTGVAATDDFALDTTEPATPLVTASPATPDDSRSPVWSFTGEGGAILECRLDRGAAEVSGWVPCGPSAVYDLTGEPDGTYTFAVRATDPAGNIGPAATSNYALDTAVPAAPTVTSAPGSPSASLAPTWSFTGETGATFECSLDPSGGGGPTWSSCTSPEAYDLSGQPDGTYTFSVRAVDAAGNAGPAANSSYVLDASAPGAPTIDTAPAAVGRARNPSWSFSAPSATSYECRLSPGADPAWDWQPCTSAKGYDLTGKSDGTYTFSVRAKDNAANTSAATSSSYTLDTAAPNVPAFVTEPPTPWHDKQPAWSFSAEADATFECELYRGASLVTQWACGQTTNADLAAQADGVYTLSVRATDAAGNTGGAATSEYALDTTAPATGITSAPATPGKSRLPSWTFFAEADAAYSCRLDRGGTQIANWGACDGPTAYDLTGKTDGTYTFSVRATDTAGNTGPVTTSDYVLDTDLPAAPAVTSSPATPGNGRSPSWTFSGEAGTTLKCRFDQGLAEISDWTVCAGNAGYDLTGKPDATYTFSVRATDAAGNDGPAASRNYALDTTAPGQPSIDSSPGATGAGTAPSWSFSGEAGAAFECRLDRGASPFSGWAPCAGSTAYDLTGEPDGTFTFSVRATDSVGNVGTARTSDYALVTAAPAAPTFLAEPLATGNTRAPAWAFATAAGTTAECRFERGTTVISDWSACLSPFSYDLSGRPDGAYELAVRAVNTVGTRSLEARSSYVLDTQAPAPPSIESSPGAVGANVTPAWSFSAEPGATLECRIDRGADLIADWAACNSPHAVSLVGQPDGSYEISVRARDAAGNQGEPARSAYRLLTSTPGSPRVTAAPGPIGRTRDVQWSFAGDADDQLECRMARGDQVVANWERCTSPRSYDLAGGSDGTYEFSVRSRNAAGTPSVPAISTYLLDTSPPARPSMRSSPRRAGNDRSPTWSFVGEAAATFDCRLGEQNAAGTWRPCVSPRSFSLAGRDDGDYVFEVHATDAAGNVSAPLSDAYELDTTPPRPPKIVASPGAEGADRSPSWSFTGELGGSFECQLKHDGQSTVDWTPCTSPRRFELPRDEEGTYGFGVRETDDAGNTGKPSTDAYRLAPKPGAAPQGGAGAGASPPPSVPTRTSGPDPEDDTEAPAADGRETSTAPAASGRRRTAAPAAKPRGSARQAHGEKRAQPPAGSHATGRSTRDSTHSAEHRGPVSRALAAVRRTVEHAATAVAENADKSVFPLSLLVLVGCFLSIQARIDRNDPKLALAPGLADSYIDFGAPARARRPHDLGAGADEVDDPGDERGMR